MSSLAAKGGERGRLRRLCRWRGRRKPLQIDILTIFPDFFESCLKISLLGKALTQGKLKVNLHNFRDYALDKHHSVDDVPYGGGAGMVLKPEPLVGAIDSILKEKKSQCVLLTPRGKPFNQKMAQDWSQLDQLILVCGRYEGVDERVLQIGRGTSRQRRREGEAPPALPVEGATRAPVIDEEVSIGDYILNGGEVAALVILDTVVRLLPGVLGNEESIAQESFQQGLLEYPQYTRPSEFQGLKVPEVLLSGNHKEIEDWRHKESLRITGERRPDLLKTYLKELQKNGKVANSPSTKK